MSAERDLSRTPAQGQCSPKRPQILSRRASYVVRNALALIRNDRIQKFSFCPRRLLMLLAAVENKPPRPIEQDKPKFNKVRQPPPDQD